MEAICQALSFLDGRRRARGLHDGFPNRSLLASCP
jgi:hypothetical protein